MDWPERLALVVAVVFAAGGLTARLLSTEGLTAGGAVAVVLPAVVLGLLTWGGARAWRQQKRR